jgi:hypothetical protein
LKNPDVIPEEERWVFLQFLDVPADIVKIQVYGINFEACQFRESP